MRRRSPRDLAASLILAEERDGAWVRDLLPEARKQLADPRDRGLLTELAYGVVRRRGSLDGVLAPLSRRPLERLQAPVRTALRLALYQVLFLERVPDHAAVDHAVTWVRRHGGRRPAGYANAVLRAAVGGVEGVARGKQDPCRDVPREDGSAVRLRDARFADPERDLGTNLAVRYACPAWLVGRWLEARGPERTRALLQAGIGRPPLTLRARADRGALSATLREAGVAVRNGPGDASLLLDSGGDATAFAAVERGDAWVQDATAQRVAPLLAPRPGQRLLDLCAAPGGKSLHLADLLAGHGEVVAADVDADKVLALSNLASRVRGAVAFQAVEIPREGPLPFEPASFDGVLVDAPCSNTGVLRRRVEARWRLRPGDIASLAALQRSILDRAVHLVRPGGRLVYATCSMEREENEGVVCSFADAHPALTLGEVVEVPAGRDGDGGYAAVLQVSE